MVWRHCCFFSSNFRICRSDGLHLLVHTIRLANVGKGWLVTSRLPGADQTMHVHLTFFAHCAEGVGRNEKTS